MMFQRGKRSGMAPPPPDNQRRVAIGHRRYPPLRTPGSVGRFLTGRPASPFRYPAPREQGSTRGYPPLPTPGKQSGFLGGGRPPLDHPALRAEGGGGGVHIRYPALREEGSGDENHIGYPAPGPGEGHIRYPAFSIPRGTPDLGPENSYRALFFKGFLPSSV